VKAKKKAPQKPKVKQIRKGKKSPIRKRRQVKARIWKPSRDELGHYLESGNPAGMKKGTKAWGSIYEMAMAARSLAIKLPGGKEKIISGRELIGFRRVSLALDRGDQRAMDEIANRTEGMPIQTVRNLGGGGGLNIIITDIDAEEIAKMSTVEIHPKKKAEEKA
jgi:hypothetical protein